MEASGYAAVLADTMKESVYLTEFYDNDINPPVKWEDGWMFVRTKEMGI
jgi:hypothetical protein